MYKSLLGLIFATFAIAPTFGEDATMKKVGDGEMKSSSSLTCDASGIGATTPNARMKATWTPTVYDLEWYDDDETQLTVQNSAKTCAYGSNLVIPSNAPSKMGYTFIGWEMEEMPACTIPAEDMNTEPTSGSGHGWYNNADVCYNYNGWTINCSTVQDLAVNQWKVAWSNGDVVNGIASCNDTLPSNWDTLMAQQPTKEELPNKEEYTVAFEAWYASVMSSLYGTNGSAIMPSNTFTSNSTGQYCWCKATHYTANNAQQCSLLSSAWVLTPEGFFEGEPEKCAERCPDLCANLSRYSLTLFFGGSITQ